MKNGEIFDKIPEINYAENLSQMNIEEFRKVIFTRRSVRVFDQTPIPPEVVNDCLDLALLAPNSSNLQPWEFYWVRTPEKKKKLVEACLSQPAARTAAELIVCVARTKTWKKYRKQMLEHFKNATFKVPDSAISYYQKLVPLAYTQGPLNLFGFFKKILFFFLGLKKPIPREPTSYADMRVWAVKSCSLACENLMLAFTAHGFDSCPMEGLDSRRVKKLLNLPRDAEVVMAISAGKRAPQGVYGPRMRFDRKDFIKEV